MVSTYSTNLRLDLQGTGDNNGTWGAVANTDFSLIDDAIAGYVKVSVSGGDTTLSTNNGSSDNARKAMIEIVGSPTSAANVIIPANSKQYIIRCSLSNSTAAIVKISGTTGYSLTNGINQYVITDGTTVTGESAKTSSGAIAGSYSLPMISVDGFGAVTSISTLASVGIAVQTSGGPLVRRVSAGAGVTVTNPDGAAGDFIIALSATGVTSATYGNPLSLNIQSDGRVASVVSSTRGRVLFVSGSATGTYTVLTTAVGLPIDNTVPSITQGTQIFNTTFTPQTSASGVKITISLAQGGPSNSNQVIALFKNSATTAVASMNNPIITANYAQNTILQYYEALTTISSVTYTVRAGSSNSTGAYLNGSAGLGALGGGNYSSSMVVEEIC